MFQTNRAIALQSGYNAKKYITLKNIFMIVDLHSSSSKNGCVVLNKLLAGGDRFEGAQLPATSARLDRSLLGMHLNSKPFFVQDRT